MICAKIPGGMVQGLAETPNKVANAVTGIEADELNEIRGSVKAGCQ